MQIFYTKFTACFRLLLSEALADRFYYTHALTHTHNVHKCQHNTGKQR